MNSWPFFNHLKELNLVLPLILIVLIVLWFLNLGQNPWFNQSSTSLAIISLGILGLIFYLLKQNHLLDEQQARFEASINNINIGFIITSPKGEVISINPAAKRILFSDGQTASPAILRNGFNHHGTVHQTSRFAELANQLRGVIDLEFQLKKCLIERKTVTIDNIQFHGLVLHIFITPIVVLEDNNLGLDFVGSVILIEDRTNQKIIERSKDEFLSIASHELKTPLGVIRSNAQMIKNYFGSQIPDKAVVEMVDDIYHSSVNLIEIVNDFLDLSRLEQGKIEYQIQSIDLVTVVEQGIAELAALAASKNIFLVFQKPVTGLPLALADPDKAKQVVLNLISNAIKYTTRGEIKIEVEQDGKMLKVLVSDTGQGIAPENQKLLFKKFQSATKNILTRDSSLRSTGIGLYISKLLVGGMGGEIKLEKSVVSIGSTFSFTLPISKEQSKSVNLPSTGYPANFLQ